MNLPEKYDPDGPSGQCHGFGPGKLKLDVILSEPDRVEYEKFLRTPGCTNETARDWLRARGYKVGIHAVEKHRAVFNRIVSDLRESARFVGAICRLAEEHGPDALPNLNMTRFEQIMMQKLCKDDAWHQEMGFDELGKVMKVIESAVDARRDVNAMRRDFETLRREAADRVAGAAGRGASGQEVAREVCELLGVPVSQPGVK
jgi:hypothetical protein